MKTLVVLGAALLALAPRAVLAHCDSLDGPVVKDARVALQSKDVTLVLKWVRASEEPAIREAFREAVAVRALGGEARALADRSFFETLVRIHRAGEGAPYTGLLPAGAPVDPGIAATDVALETGSADALAKMLAAKVDEGIRLRHARAAAARHHAGESVARGREYVAAYVELMHYAERLLQAATTPAAHGGAAEHVH